MPLTHVSNPRAADIASAAVLLPKQEHICYKPSLTQSKCFLGSHFISVYWSYETRIHSASSCLPPQTLQTVIYCPSTAPVPCRTLLIIMAHA